MARCCRTAFTLAIAIVYESIVTLGFSLIFAISDLSIRNADGNPFPWLIICITLVFILVDYWYIKEILTQVEQVVRCLVDQVFLVVMIFLLVPYAEEFEIPENQNSVVYKGFSQNQDTSLHVLIAAGQIIVLRSFMNEILLTYVSIKTDYYDIVR